MKRLIPRIFPTIRKFEGNNPEETAMQINMYLFKDVNNKDEELEKAYRLIQFCRERGIKDYVIYIVYYEERLLKEKGRDIEVGLEYVDYRTHRIDFTEKDAETVRTPKDLEKYLTVFPR